MKSKIYEVDKNTFSEFVRTSNTFSEILNKCKLENKGGNINTLQRRIKNENLNTDHIPKGQSSNTGRIFSKRRTSKEEAFSKHFIENSKTNRNIIKKLIKRYNLIPYECIKCHNTGHWENNPLSLQIDHINGIYNDNRINNIRFLCPNCHSQTENFAGKRNKKKYYCIKCNSEKQSKLSKTCKLCYSLLCRKVKRPSKETLTSEVESMPYIEIGKKYNVYPNIIKKWCKFYNISLPNRRGYWQKKQANKL